MTIVLNGFPPKNILHSCLIPATQPEQRMMKLKNQQKYKSHQEEESVKTRTCGWGRGMPIVSPLLQGIQLKAKELALLSGALPKRKGQSEGTLVMP